MCPLCLKVIVERLVFRLPPGIMEPRTAQKLKKMVCFVLFLGIFSPSILELTEFALTCSSKVILLNTVDRMRPSTFENNQVFV